MGKEHMKSKQRNKCIKIIIDLKKFLKRKFKEKRKGKLRRTVNAQCRGRGL